ncbi:MAG: acyltransferase [Bacteroidetes bacterium]|nr:acyltransferase [Bacteroidota bacterium]
MSNPTGQKITPAYFPNLDALRFLAAFSVFVFHYFRDIRSFYPGIESNRLFDVLLVVADKGGLGVNFFFVLSGFLITYLILCEKQRTGHFSLRKFLIRRTLRIWPVYFVVVAIGFLLFPVLFDSYHTVHNPTLYLFFLANFDEIYHGANDSVNFLTAPWSVAVEEQFYLFWSLALFPLLKIKTFRLEYLILVLYLASFYFRWINLDNERVIYYHTFSVCQDILTGAFIGLSLFNGKRWISALTNLPKWSLVLIYLAGFLICLGKNKIFAGDLQVTERFVLSLFFGFIILDQSLGKNSVIKAGKFKLLNDAGKISYGFYMYHLIVMFVLCRLIETYLPTGYYLIPLYFLVSLAGTVLCAALSYKFMEAPLLKLKPKD